MTFKSPLLDRRPFVPARYTELRTLACHALRRACEGLEAADDRKLVGALVEGRAILQEADALWRGEVSEAEARCVGSPGGFGLAGVDAARKGRL